MVAWMIANKRENPLYAKFDRVVSILKKYDTVLSLGNDLRAGAIHDSSDRSQCKARRDLDWKKQFERALFPEDARAIRASRTPEDEGTCTMRGDFCASRGTGKLFADDLKGDKI